MTGHFLIGVDDKAKVVLVEGVGFWTLTTIDTHFDYLFDVIAKQRRLARPVRVLIDVCQADIQPSDVIDRIGLRSALIYEPGDRVAIVVASSLAKIQMKRGVIGVRHEFFFSPRSAMSWLCAGPQVHFGEAANRPGHHN